MRGLRGVGERRGQGKGEQVREGVKEQGKGTGVGSATIMLKFNCHVGKGL